MEWLVSAFSWVCGQTPERTWAPGGELLPLCQRCTGIYLGACASLIVHLTWRAPLGSRWRWWCVGLMLPLPVSLLEPCPDTPVIRTVSGLLFGGGTLGLLCLLPRQWWPWRLPTGGVRLVLALGLVGLGLLAGWLAAGRTHSFAVSALCGLALLGLLAMAFLAAVNVVGCAVALSHWRRRDAR